jgi:P27 family predicted phage terminase small subunit
MARGGARRGAGRKPVPTALKLLRGNPGRRPIEADLEPQPEPVLPTCPRQLGTVAKREWRRIAPELHKLGLLTRIDRAALAAYCATYQQFIEAEVAIRTAAPDCDVRSVMRIQAAALTLMHRYLVEFGMTPASRSRVRVADIAAAAKVPEDEAFLANRGLKVIK